MDKLPPIHPKDQYFKLNELFCTFNQTPKEDCFNEYKNCISSSKLFLKFPLNNKECCRKMFVHCEHKKRDCCKTNDHDPIIWK